MNTAVVLVCSKTHEVKEASATGTGQTFLVAGAWGFNVASFKGGVGTHTRILMLSRILGSSVSCIPCVLVTMREAITGTE